MLAHSRTPPPQASRRLCTAGLSKLPAEAARVERPRKWRRTSAKLRCIHCCLADAAWAACMRDGDDRPHAARQEPAPGSQGSSRLLPHFERPTSTAKQKDAKLGNKKTARLIHRWHTLGPRRGMAGRSMTPHTSAIVCVPVRRRCRPTPADFRLSQLRTHAGREPDFSSVPRGRSSRPRVIYTLRVRRKTTTRQVRAYSHSKCRMKHVHTGHREV